MDHSRPFCTRSDASVAPDGPLPIMPTVLVVFLIGATGFLSLRSEPIIYYVVLFMQTIPRPVRLVKFEFGGGSIGGCPLGSGVACVIKWRRALPNIADGIAGSPAQRASEMTVPSPGCNRSWNCVRSSPTRPDRKSVV